MTRHSAVGNCANAIHRPFRERELVLSHVHTRLRIRTAEKRRPIYEGYIFRRVKNTTAVNTSYFSLPCAVFPGKFFRNIPQSEKGLREKDFRVSERRLFNVRQNLQRVIAEWNFVGRNAISREGPSSNSFTMFRPEEGYSFAHPSGGFPGPVNSRVGVKTRVYINNMWTLLLNEYEYLEWI